MAHGAALAAALIPEKAQPPKVFFQLVSVFAGAALRVQVLDAENDPPAPALGAQPCKELHARLPRWSRPLGLGRTARRQRSQAQLPLPVLRLEDGGCCNTLPRPLPCTRVGAACRLHGGVHGQLAQTDVHHRYQDLMAQQIAQRGAARHIGAVCEHLHRHTGLLADGGEGCTGESAGGVGLAGIILQQDAAAPSRRGWRGRSFRGGWDGWRGRCRRSAQVSWCGRGCSALC